MVSDNVAVQHYNPQLHARRIKSTRMVLRWQDKSGAQFLVRPSLDSEIVPVRQTQSTGWAQGAISLAEAAALRSKLHNSQLSRHEKYEILFPSGWSIDASPGFQRREGDDGFEQARSLLRFFSSDTWFDRQENIQLVKGLSQTDVEQRAAFYQGVARCRRDAGVRWQSMPVGKAIQSRDVAELERVQLISDKVLTALYTKYGRDEAKAKEAFAKFDKDGNGSECLAPCATVTTNHPAR